MRLKSAIVGIFLIISSGQALGQSSQAQISSDINTTIFNNTSGQISASAVNALLQEMNASYLNSISSLGPGVATALSKATNANGGFPTVSVSATAPATPSLFQPWLNTTATPYVWNIWDGASWVALGTINATTHALTLPTLNLAATPSGGFGGVSGVLPAANGGAGTINGVLQGNGSGLVSQADGTSGHKVPWLDGVNTASAQWSFNGGIAATQALSGTYLADYYSNPITLNVGAVVTAGHNNYGLGPTCNVNSASYRGQLFCAYSHVDVQAFAAGLNTPDNAFVSNFSYATASGNITSTNAGLFGGNDNAIVIGTGWSYLVGREIDVTTYQPIQNKDGLRIAQGSADAYQGSVTDGAIHIIKLPGGIGWKNIFYLDAVNGGVLSTTGCILCVASPATVTTGFDVSAWTFTGYQWKSTGMTIDGGGSINLTGSSANHSPITFTDTNTGGQTWVMGPGVGVGTAGSFNIYDSTNLTTLFKLTSAGGIVITGGFMGTNATFTAAAPTVAAGQIGFGATTTANTNCGTLAGSAGCVVINVAGTTRYFPYY